MRVGQRVCVAKRDSLLKGQVGTIVSIEGTMGMGDFEHPTWWPALFVEIDAGRAGWFALDDVVAIDCPATGEPHRLDDGRCMDCNWDEEYTR